MTEEEFKLFLRKQAEEILDISVDQVLGEVADKVIAEEKGVQSSEMMAGKENEKENGRSIGLTTEGVQPLQPMVHNNLEEMAKISEATTSPVRFSPRLVHSKDEHTLTKAEERVAKKNLECLGGMPSTTFCSFNASETISNLEQIGLCFGSTENDKYDLVQQLFVLDKHGDEVDDSYIDQTWPASESEEENIETLEINALKSLCGELMEEVFERDSLHLSSDIKAVARPCKSHAKPCRKKTCKVRLSNHFKNCVK